VNVPIRINNSTRKDTHNKINNMAEW
jgi:hypothetical protein